MSVLRIPFFVMKTLTAQTPMDLTLVLAERDSQAMDPPVQVNNDIFLFGHFYYKNTANKMQCQLLHVFLMIPWPHAKKDKYSIRERFTIQILEQSSN